MTKAKGLLLAVAVAAMAFTFSCGDNSWLDGGSSSSESGGNSLTYNYCLINGQCLSGPFTSKDCGDLGGLPSNTCTGSNPLSSSSGGGSSSSGGGGSSSSLGGGSSSSGGGEDDFALKAWTLVENSPFGTSHVYDVAYGNDVWVAVGDEGKIAYSADARSWTLVPAGADPGTSTFMDNRNRPLNVTDVAFGNGTFIAVSGSRMASSTDGMNWTVIESTADISVNDIAFGGGIWLAVGAMGRIATSTDGTSWIAVDVSDILGREAFATIAYGNNMWVAGGSRGVTATSMNGTSWTAVAAPPFSAGTNRYVASIAYGGNRFVAVGNSTASRANVAYSTDGTSWTMLNSTIAFAGIVFGNNRFVAVGHQGKAAYSADGLTWTEIANPGFGTTKINKVAHGNGTYVAVGMEGNIAWVNEE